MGAAAVAAAKAVNYVGAGTVEFIVGPKGDFHFMEMNTRLQVEHPVTEMTHGIDLVEWQLRVADGEPLPMTQDLIRSRGHAIEVRLYAEDPDHGFLPGSGKLTRLQLPEASAHVRLDGGVIEGDTVTIFYDPMIAKLIVWDVDRPSALQRMREALAACEITGPKSNVAFLERLVRHPAIVEHRIDTGYLDRHLDEFIVGDAEPDVRTLFGASVAALLHDESHVPCDPADPHSPWNRADAWRVGHAGKRLVALSANGRRFEIEGWGHAGAYRLQAGESRCVVEDALWDGRNLSARLDGAATRFEVRADASRVLLHDANGVRWRFERVPAFAWEASDGAAGNQVTAPMPGRIVLVRTTPGDTVEAGQELLVMEAMKMELSLKAPRAGVIDSIGAAANDFVDADAVLIEFKDE
jgi:3-methylcrotonyl-CoA carboxylase alpha subunit